MASIAAIEGIGAKYAAKLQAAGVKTVETLLENGATRKGRNELAKVTGLADEKVLAWVNRADLMRIKGVSSQYSDLLEASGVDTVKELAKRKAEALATTMLEVNSKKKNKLVQRPPSAVVVQKWIDQAKELPKVVKH